MVVALAGRRVDAEGSLERAFPAENIPLVRERLRLWFAAHAVSAVVASAAAGADLLALDVAGSLSIPRCIILPFDLDRFRETSVADRPGDWGPLYDCVIAEADGLVVTAGGSDGDAAYGAANDAILKRAAELAEQMHDGVGALLVWNGVARRSGDLTAAFGEAARERGWQVSELLTMP